MTIINKKNKKLNILTKQFCLLVTVALWLGLSSFQTLHADAYENKLQTLKKDVLELNRDLTILEEELLYPSTQLSLFLSLDVGTFIRLVDVNLILNNKHIGYHFYTDEEFESLRKGAVHKLYTGNVISGEHRLQVIITGYGPDGSEYKKEAEYTFNKDTDRKFIELKIVDNLDETEHEFEFKEWE